MGTGVWNTEGRALVMLKLRSGNGSQPVDWFVDLVPPTKSERLFHSNHEQMGRVTTDDIVKILRYVQPYDLLNFRALNRELWEILPLEYVLKLFSTAKADGRIPDMAPRCVYSAPYVIRMHGIHSHEGRYLGHVTSVDLYLGWTLRPDASFWYSVANDTFRFETTKLRWERQLADDVLQMFLQPADEGGLAMNGGGNDRRWGMPEDVKPPGVRLVFSSSDIPQKSQLRHCILWDKQQNKECHAPRDRPAGTFVRLPDTLKIRVGDWLAELKMPAEHPVGLGKQLDRDLSMLYETLWELNSAKPPPSPIKGRLGGHSWGPWVPIYESDEEEEVDDGEEEEVHDYLRD
jgi:hypothetical protein